MRKTKYEIAEFKEIRSTRSGMYKYPRFTDAGYSGYTWESYNTGRCDKTKTPPRNFDAGFPEKRSK